MRIDAEIEWIQMPRLASRWNLLTHRLRAWLGCQPPAPDEYGELWTQTRCLYALVHPNGSRILYIGKAWSKTVVQRLRSRDKRRVYETLRRKHDLSMDQLIPMVGVVNVDAISRLTHVLLAEIESMLIFYTEPTGNRACTSSYRCRDYLAVRCSGDWPLRQRTFIDEESFAEGPR